MKLAERNAYPVPNDANANDQEGMTMREHFAGLAMQGMLTNPALSDETAEMIAAMAIVAADALINELEKDQ